MERVEITRGIVGITHMQVCAVADATDEEILAACNAENPSGTQLGWVQVVHEGKLAPVLCAQDHARMHFMVCC